MIKCGHCKGRHSTVNEVRQCAECRAELAAEKRLERHFEDRGYNEARGQEAYEESLGIVHPSYAISL